MALELNKLPWYGQLAIFGGISILAVVVFYYMFVTDMNAQIDGLQGEIRQLEEVIARGRAAEARRELLQQEIEMQNKNLERLRRILPERQEVDDILRKIQGLASESNLNILRFEPGAEAKQEFYVEWPIKIDISGTYHNLAMFFDKIGRFPRIFNVFNLNISAIVPPKENLTITSNCTAATYIYVESKPVPAPSPAAAPRPAKPPAAGDKDKLPE